MEQTATEGCRFSRRWQHWSSALLIASAKSTYEKRRNHFLQISADIILVDRILANYGVETKDARAVLQRAVDQFWSASRARPATIDRKTSSVEALFDDIQQLSRHSEAQRFLQSQALTMALDLGHSRVLLFEQLGSLIPLPFLVVLVFWLSIIFASFGLFAPRKRDHNRRFLPLYVVGLRCNISDPGARPILRKVASGLQRPAARGLCAVRPVRK